MPGGTETGERVVVAVCSGAPSRDVIRWALANKIKRREDTLIFLHVVSKIPSAIGGDMSQGEVTNTMFVHYVRTVVQPMMLQLKKLVPSKVKLELKVARSNTTDKAIIDETTKLRAHTLLIGVNAKGMSNLQSATSTSGFCMRNKPPGIAILVVHKDRVVMAKETDGAASDSSSRSSPANSGRLSGSVAADGGGRKSREQSFGRPDNVAVELDKSLPRPGNVATHSGATAEESSSQKGAATPTKGLSPAARLLNARSIRYGTWNGGSPGAEHSNEGVLPPSGMSGEKMDERRASSKENDKGKYKQSPGGGAGPGEDNLSRMLEGSLLLDNTSRDIQNELSSWSSAIAKRHQLSRMDEVEDRVAKAKAAMAMFPHTIGKQLDELERESGQSMKLPSVAAAMRQEARNKAPAGVTSGNDSPLGALLADSALLADASGDVQDELSSWSNAIQKKHQLSEMRATEGNLAKARAAMANYPAAFGRGEQEGGGRYARYDPRQQQSPFANGPEGRYGGDNLSAGLAGSPLLANASEDVQDELSSWSNAIREKHQLAYMKGAEDRVAKARAALAAGQADVDGRTAGLGRQMQQRSFAPQGWGSIQEDAFLANSPLLANAAGDVQNELGAWSKALQERHRVAEMQGMEAKLANARAAMASERAVLNSYLPDNAWAARATNMEPARQAPRGYAQPGWAGNTDDAFLANSPLLANASGDAQNELAAWSSAIQQRHHVSNMKGMDAKLAKARATLATQQAHLNAYLPGVDWGRTTAPPKPSRNAGGSQIPRGWNGIAEDAFLADSPLLANATGDAQNELASWSKAIQERHRVSDMRGMDAKLAKARAALASEQANLNSYLPDVNWGGRAAPGRPAGNAGGMGRLPRAPSGWNGIAEDAFLAGSPLFANASGDAQNELASWAQAIQERHRVSDMKSMEAKLAQARAALASEQANLNSYQPDRDWAGRGGGRRQPPRTPVHPAWASISEDAYLANSPLLANATGDVRDELSSWTQAIEERHQLSYMNGMEDRLAKARAALASVPGTLNKYMPDEADSGPLQRPAESAAESHMMMNRNQGAQGAGSPGGLGGRNANPLASLLAGSSLLANASGDIQDELSAWTNSIQEKHLAGRKQDTEAKLAQTKTAMAASLEKRLQAETDMAGGEQSAHSFGKNSFGSQRSGGMASQASRRSQGLGSNGSSPSGSRTFEKVPSTNSRGKRNAFLPSSSMVSDVSGEVQEEHNSWSKSSQERYRTSLSGGEDRLSRARAALASIPASIQEQQPEPETSRGRSERSAGNSSSYGRRQVELLNQPARQESGTWPADSPGLDNTPMEIQDELAAWTQAIQQRHQVAEMRGAGDRIARAKATLASFPDIMQSRFGGEYANAQAEMAAYQPRYQSMDEEPSPLLMGQRGGTGMENALLVELAMMRKRAAEAERAREEAERRAEQMMHAATLSLHEVEMQQRRMELENAALVERANRDAQRAMYTAEEVAQKTEEALKQAQSALEMESMKRQKAEQDARKGSQLTRYRQYTWDELLAATEQFSEKRKIGEGGFGTVYWAILHHTKMAVKVLKNTNAMQAAHEFEQEVEVLGQIQHPHTVMLLGCCPERYALVYEYMANGSLEERLACKNATPPLPWYARLRIAAEVASALLVLHTQPVPIVHRDLKPANILLDKNYSAKLGDVGLARLMPELNDNQTYMRDSSPVGTFAYVDPEFQRTGEFGPKSDVYALGIVMLDLLTGRKPSTYEDMEDAIEEGDVDKVVAYLDEKAGKWRGDLAMEVARMAVRCSEMRRRKRPDLELEVMPLLEKVRDAAVMVEDAEAQRRSRPGFGDAPSCLFCPITQEMMVNPVLASDGHTYELVAIQQWLEKNDRSPMTNIKLPNKDLVPNHAVRSMIQEWQERRA